MPSPWLTSSGHPPGSGTAGACEGQAQDLNQVDVSSLNSTGLVDNELPRTTTRTGRLSLGRAQPPGPPHTSLPRLQELHSSLEQGSPFPKPDSWTFSGQRAYSPPSCCRPLPPWASGVEAAGSRGEVPGTQPKELRAHGMEPPSTSEGSERTPPLQITGGAP